MADEQARQYRMKPVVVEAMRWVDSPTPVIDWVLANGGTARYHEQEPQRLHSTYCRCDGRGIVPGQVEAQRCPEAEPQGPDIPEHIHIDTLDGTMTADMGDWVIRGIQGEFYTCKPDIFARTYEEADRG